MNNSFQIPLTKAQLLQKLKEFCSYQERCHQEVRDKAFALGLHSINLSEIIAELIEENYLNEERFAIQYAGGKFRMKHWGKVKIRYALRQKQISDYCIKKALKQIDDEDYGTVLLKLAERKQAQLSATKSSSARKAKLYQYLISRGFESDLVNEVIAER